VVCQSCVDKLASRLVKNHPKLDWIRAKELASDGIERVERKKPQKIIVVINGVEVDPDYTQVCGLVSTCPNPGSCVVDEDCGGASICYIECPAPLPHSHYVSTDCWASSAGNCVCSKSICGAVCNYFTDGYCYYDCDEGYTWNGEECIPEGPSVVLRRLLVGVGL